MSLKPVLKRYIPYPVRHRLRRTEDNVRWNLYRTRKFLSKDFEVEDVGGELTCVAFSGLRLNWYFPHYEFRRTLDQLSVNRIYVRDYWQRWYLGGLKGVPGGFDGACRELGRQIDALGVPAFSMGVSMGGYAALIFAARLQLAGVLAFGPQVFIDAESRERFGDDRWAPEIARTLARFPEPLNAREELLRAPVPGPIELWCGSDDPVDGIHAGLIADLPGVRIHEIASEHATALQLRDDGRLQDVVEAFVESVKPSQSLPSRS